ncbi:hded protein [Kaistia algarum]|uniref:HdeD family acid-resistance protein n=1 Tax=Kaistia algarum TaxID=2083279 RepID=UPI000CE7A446|nr:HdeD family acid-resistance protein [Kaistia algarum]MCX5516053.1 HdeD family acid-resistance protein [Kaistia algarum]PPE77979.1 hded protein [Kaistia algarum]
MATTVYKSISQTVQEKWGWFMLLGIVFLIGGFFAIAMPLVSSIAVGIFLAAVLVVAGIFQIWQAFSVQSWTGFIWQLLIGIIMLIGGIAIYMSPATGSIALTLVIAAVFIAKGVFQIVLGFRLRPHDGWGWILAAGIVALLVGVMILSQYPFSGLWVPGTLAGISLLFTGWSYIALGLAAKRIA